MTNTAALRLTVAPSKNTPDMPRAFVRADGATVGKLSGMAIFTELAEKLEDFDDVQAGLGPAFKSARQPDHLEVPIFYRSRWWECLSTHRHFMHGPRPEVSPSRWVREATFRAVGAGRDVGEFIVMSTHMTAFAFSNHFPPGSENQRWCLEQWNLHYAKMQALVTARVDGGHTVIFGGDFNRGVMAKFRPDQRWLINGGIDKLAVIEAPGSARVTLKSVERHNVHSDHDARTAHLVLRGPQ